MREKERKQKEAMQAFPASPTVVRGVQGDGLDSVTWGERKREREREKGIADRFDAGRWLSIDLPPDSCEQRTVPFFRSLL